MALTNKEIQCVVLYLGWPSKTVIVNSTHYSKIFVDRISNLDSDAEVKIREYLSRVEKIREQIDEAQCRLSTSEVDNIVLREDEIARLCGLERKWLRQLSEFLDLPMMRSSANSVCLTV